MHRWPTREAELGDVGWGDVGWGDVGRGDVGLRRVACQRRGELTAVDTAPRDPRRRHGPRAKGRGIDTVETVGSHGLESWWAISDAAAVALGIGDAADVAPGIGDAADVAPGIGDAADVAPGISAAGASSGRVRLSVPQSTSDPQWLLIPNVRIRIGEGPTVTQGQAMAPMQLFLAQSNGVVSRAELLASGFTPGQIQRARRAGHLRTAVPGVYVAATRSPESWTTRCLVALKHAGTGAAASHWTAATVWGVHRTNHPGPIHVTVPHGRHCRGHRGMVIHHGRQLIGIAHSGIRVTPLLRTLVDVTSIASLTDSRMVVMDAVGQGLVTPTQMRAVGHLPPGTRLPWRLMTQEAEAGAISGGEAAYWRLIKDAALPLPVLNQSLRTDYGLFCPDALWPGLDMFAEIDGREFHAQAQAFDRDRIRQNALHIHGLVGLRFAVNDVLNQPDIVVRQTRELLELRAAERT